MRSMNEVVRMQGRDWKTEDIERIRGLIAENPAWSRRRLSEGLAAEWNWRNGAGRLKDSGTDPGEDGGAGSTGCRRARRRRTGWYALLS
jgi:hypothetical protein